jgi:hypothetical protein
LSKIVRVTLEGAEHSFSVDSQLPLCFEERGTFAFLPEQVGVRLLPAPASRTDEVDSTGMKIVNATHDLQFLLADGLA